MEKKINFSLLQSKSIDTTNTTNTISSWIQIINEPSFNNDLIEKKYSENPLTINIYPFLISMQLNVLKNNSHTLLKIKSNISSLNNNLKQVCPTKIIDSLNNKHCQDVRINMSCSLQQLKNKDTDELQNAIYIEYDVKYNFLYFQKEYLSQDIKHFIYKVYEVLMGF